MTRITLLPAALAAATFVFAATGAANAQSASAPMASGTSAALSSLDRKFVQDAGAGGAAEVALGKLATGKSTRDDVKQFGQQMVDDHTKAGDELKQIATSKGLMPPTAPTAAQQKTADQMAKRSGASFDKSFLAQMEVDHVKTIALFKRESASGGDADLKAFATKTLPTLEGHLKMVRMLETKGGPMNRAINEKAASAPN